MLVEARGRHARDKQPLVTVAASAPWWVIPFLLLPKPLLAPLSPPRPQLLACVCVLVCA